MAVRRQKSKSPKVRKTIGNPDSDSDSDDDGQIQQLILDQAEEDARIKRLQKAMLESLEKSCREKYKGRHDEPNSSQVKKNTMQKFEAIASSTKLTNPSSNEINKVSLAILKLGKLAKEDQVNILAKCENKLREYEGNKRQIQQVSSRTELYAPSQENQSVLIRKCSKTRTIDFNRTMVPQVNLSSARSQSGAPSQENQSNLLAKCLSKIREKGLTNTPMTPLTGASSRDRFYARSNEGRTPARTASTLQNARRLNLRFFDELGCPQDKPDTIQSLEQRLEAIEKALCAKQNVVNPCASLHAEPDFGFCTNIPQAVPNQVMVDYENESMNVKSKIILIEQQLAELGSQMNKSVVNKCLYQERIAKLEEDIISTKKAYLNILQTELTNLKKDIDTKDMKHGAVDAMTLVPSEQMKEKPSSKKSKKGKGKKGKSAQKKGKGKKKTASGSPSRKKPRSRATSGKRQ